MAVVRLLILSYHNLLLFAWDSFFLLYLVWVRNDNVCLFRKSWKFVPTTVEQCRGEMLTETEQRVLKEGCQVHSFNFLMIWSGYAREVPYSTTRIRSDPHFFSGFRPNIFDWIWSGSGSINNAFKIRISFKISIFLSSCFTEQFSTVNLVFVASFRLDLDPWSGSDF
jgi:hypothetical protein